MVITRTAMAGPGKEKATGVDALTTPPHTHTHTHTHLLHTKVHPGEKYINAMANSPGSMTSYSMVPTKRNNLKLL